MHKRLYYLTSAGYALQNISKQRLKISRIDDLNDPFELRPGNSQDRELRKKFLDFRKSFHEEHGVICFSQRWSNPVLWSHYGDKHRGICLGFDVCERYVFPVKYVDSVQQFDLTAMEYENVRGLDFARDEVAKVLTTKFRHWEYEDEMRAFCLLDHSAALDGLYFYEFGAELRLREVIIGARCEEKVERVCEISRSVSNDIKVRKSRLAFTKFEVIEHAGFTKRISRYMQMKP
ncbi:DUF2971 domain-containing protein [Pseudoxanthomonas winnipegensis]|uniref:DUF2971 domain-containing protein n=1 Tax=Pseudoxanthomonas winnipegensis TaxID=2480810 RepID=A0A4Q8LXS1_9GAMM|nr:DUF2971 domain-containing protein [Pseudoxanthomonas winnipegensis]RZZ90772.1 DUF2971 domain-containing protein [Pseudoxanthomonas winnipegensis]TAA36118.1 DUF2971 domain-containing protein [Pseudoxanthomonas winnipegensis]